MLAAPRGGGVLLNGGKRAYVTRVVPNIATYASRDLFFADPAASTPGDTAAAPGAAEHRHRG